MGDDPAARKSYDSRRCDATGKLKFLCGCEHCQSNANQMRKSEEDWAEAQRQARQEELAMMRGGAKDRAVMFEQRSSIATKEPPSRGTLPVAFNSAGAFLARGASLSAVAGTSTAASPAEKEADETGEETAQAAVDDEEEGTAAEESISLSTDRRKEEASAGQPQLPSLAGAFLSLPDPLTQEREKEDEEPPPPPRNQAAAAAAAAAVPSSSGARAFLSRGESLSIAAGTAAAPMAAPAPSSQEDGEEEEESEELEFELEEEVSEEEDEAEAEGAADELRAPQPSGEGAGEGDGEGGGEGGAQADAASLLLNASLGASLPSAVSQFLSADLNASLPLNASLTSAGGESLCSGEDLGASMESRGAAPMWSMDGFEGSALGGSALYGREASPPAD